MDRDNHTVPHTLSLIAALVNMVQPNSSRPKIMIIGAGVAGLTFAIALRRQLCYENFVIIEKADVVGGTWRENRYPGSGCDTPIHYYSLSTDLNPDWTSTHAFQPEIEAYWVRLKEKYGLSSYIAFGCECVTASWDLDAQLYHITTKDVKTGKQTVTTAHILISGVGAFHVPKFPDIPGIKDFQGLSFHSSSWMNTELAGKRVAVIGNGSSAAQFIPEIAVTPKIHVTQFCRTPCWLRPNLRTLISPWQRWIFRHLPFALRVYRIYIYLKQESIYFSVFGSQATRDKSTKAVTRYILDNCPTKYHAHIVPDYSLGCKRTVIDTGYLACLHQDNIKVNWDGISSIVEHGVVTLKGEVLNFDTIIYATGFVTDSFPLPIRGKNKYIQEYYKSEGGPTAYLGVCTPGFPNFFIFSGAHTVTHSSHIFTIETHANYIISLIKPIIEGKLSSVDVTTEATDAYNTKLEDRLSDSVFVNCLSWFHPTPDSKVNAFPGTHFLLWWWLRWPNWSHYQLVERFSDSSRNGLAPSLRFGIWLVIISVASASLILSF